MLNLASEMGWLIGPSNHVYEGSSSTLPPRQLTFSRSSYEAPEDLGLTNIILPRRVRHLDLIHRTQLLSPQSQFVPVHRSHLPSGVDHGLGCRF